MQACQGNYDAAPAYPSAARTPLYRVSEPTGVYSARNPRATSLYALLERHYETVKSQWEDRFESRYGFWRGFVDEAVARYLDCGILENGFARARCGACSAEFLVAFSCKLRAPCPSCAAKRAATFAAFLREEVLEPVGHAQWVFTLPKMLRPYYLHHRELLGELCRVSYETVHELMSAAAEEDVRPGFVAVVQTHGAKLNWNPHIHALATRGGWTREHEWVPLAYLDDRAAELLFRHKVLKALLARALLSEERAALLLGWRHNTGFSVHNHTTVAPDEEDSLERLARYLLRPPVSLERLSFDEGAEEVRYRHKSGHDVAEEVEQSFDALEFLARVVVHIPQPRLHLTRYYGAYSAVVRARRRQHVQRAPPPRANATEHADAETYRNPARRRRWAELIRRIYATDPLICRNCGHPMAIIAFITERRVILKILRHLDKRHAQQRGPPQAP